MSDLSVGQEGQRYRVRDEKPQNEHDGRPYAASFGGEYDCSFFFIPEGRSRISEADIVEDFGQWCQDEDAACKAPYIDQVIAP